MAERNTATLQSGIASFLFSIQESTSKVYPESIQIIPHKEYSALLNMIMDSTPADNNNKKCQPMSPAVLVQSHYCLAMYLLQTSKPINMGNRVISEQLPTSLTNAAQSYSNSQVPPNNSTWTYNMCAFVFFPKARPYAGMWLSTGRSMGERGEFDIRQRR